MYIHIYIGIKRALRARSGPLWLGPCGPAGPLRAGPLWAPCVLLGQALVGHHGLLWAGRLWATIGSLWARPSWAPLGPYGPDPCLPHRIVMSRALIEPPQDTLRPMGICGYQQP